MPRAEADAARAALVPRAHPYGRSPSPRPDRAAPRAAWALSRGWSPRERGAPEGARADYVPPSKDLRTLCAQLDPQGAKNTDQQVRDWLTLPLLLRKNSIYCKSLSARGGRVPTRGAADAARRAQVALSIGAIGGVQTRDRRGNVTDALWVKYSEQSVVGMLLETSDIRKILLEQIQDQIKARRDLIQEVEQTEVVCQWLMAFTKSWEQEYSSSIVTRFDIGQLILSAMSEAYFEVLALLSLSPLVQTHAGAHGAHRFLVGCVRAAGTRLAELQAEATAESALAAARLESLAEDLRERLRAIRADEPTTSHARLVRAPPRPPRVPSRVRRRAFRARVRCPARPARRRVLIARTRRRPSCSRATPRPPRPRPRSSRRAAGCWRRPCTRATTRWCASCSATRTRGA